MKGIVTLCDFPSWYETDDGPVYLTDADIDNPALPHEFGADICGHHAIRLVYPKIEGRILEGWARVPAAMLEDIMAGKLDRIAAASGIELLRPADGAKVAGLREGQVVLVAHGTVEIVGQAGGECEALDNATINSTSQAGGACMAFGNATINATSQAGGYCGARDNATINRIEGETQ